MLLVVEGAGLAGAAAAAGARGRRRRRGAPLGEKQTLWGGWRLRGGLSFGVAGDVQVFIEPGEQGQHAFCNLLGFAPVKVFSGQGLVHLGDILFIDLLRLQFFRSPHVFGQINEALHAGMPTF